MAKSILQTQAHEPGQSSVLTHALNLKTNRSDGQNPCLPVRSIDDIDLSPRKDTVPMSSPEDWRDHTLYCILVDRFNRGSGAVSPSGDPTRSNTLHGGNLNGIYEKLDYIAGLGVTALWITPVCENPVGPQSYHGYAPRNLLDTDPARGSMDDLRNVVNEAHRQNIRVILDFVANHTCHAFLYDSPTCDFEPMCKPPKKLKSWVEQLIPIELNDAEHFYRRGDISDWEHPDHAIYGDFISQPGKSYKAINTENVATQQILIKVAKYWISQCGIDGLRLDAVRHISPSFWKRFNVEIRQHAAALGKHNFLLLGEVERPNIKQISPYLTAAYGCFDSLFDFEMHRTFVDFVHGVASTGKMVRSFVQSELEVKDKDGFFTKFLDSHDTRRFLTHTDDDKLLEVGYTFVMTTTGMPCLFYGTEQCLRDGKIEEVNEDLDRCRTDMFSEGRFRSVGQPDDCFNMTSFGYKLTQKLGQIRRRYAALRRGVAIVHTKVDDDTGTFAYARVLNEEEVLVVLNPTGDNVMVRAVPVTVRSEASNCALVDLLHGDVNVRLHQESNGATSVDVELPPLSAVILARSSSTKEQGRL